MCMVSCVCSRQSAKSYSSQDSDMTFQVDDGFNSECQGEKWDQKVLTWPILEWIAAISCFVPCWCQYSHIPSRKKVQPSPKIIVWNFHKGWNNHWTTIFHSLKASQFQTCRRFPKGWGKIAHVTEMKNQSARITNHLFNSFIAVCRHRPLKHCSLPTKKQQQHGGPHIICNMAPAHGRRLPRSNHQR